MKKLLRAVRELIRRALGVKSSKCVENQSRLSSPEKVTNLKACACPGQKKSLATPASPGNSQKVSQSRSRLSDKNNILEYKAKQNNMHKKSKKQVFLEQLIQDNYKIKVTGYKSSFNKVILSGSKQSLAVFADCSRVTGKTFTKIKFSPEAQFSLKKGKYPDKKATEMATRVQKWLDKKGIAATVEIQNNLPATWNPAGWRKQCYVKVVTEDPRYPWQQI